MPSASILVQAVAFVGFFLVAVVVPGVSFQRVLRLPVDRALVLPLGFLLCAGFYFLTLTLGWPWLFPLLLLMAACGALVGGRPRAAEGPPLRSVLPAFVAAVLLLAVTRYGLNRVGPDGDFLLDGLNDEDTAFHAGLTWELTLGFPPQVPGLAGIPLGYHMGAGLVRAAALRYFGVAPYDALTRFEPTVLILALLMALQGMAHALRAPKALVWIVPWTVLAGDLSFVFAFDTTIRYWTDTLGGNLLLAWVTGDAVVAALAMALASLIALGRHVSGEGKRWLWLAALLACGVPIFKVFVAVPYLVALGLGLLLTRERRALVTIGLPLLVSSLFQAFGRGTGTVEVVLDPLAGLKVLPSWMPALPAPLGLLLWTTLFVPASLGFRVVGLPAAWRALRSRHPPAVLLAILALLGLPLGLLLRISPRDLPAQQKLFNEAFRFVEQSGALLWIFAAWAVASWAGTARRRALAVVCAALTLPSTAQFVARKVSRPVRIVPASVLEAMSSLAASSRPGEVILQRPDPRYPPPPVVFIGRRVPYTRILPYLTQFASRSMLDQRLERVRRFFHTEDPQEALRIAAEMEATHLCLFGNDRVMFPPRGVLVPLVLGPEARVYRILR